MALGKTIARLSGQVLVVNDDLRVVDWTGPRFNGASPDALRGRSCFEAIHAVDAESGRRCRENCPALDGGKTPGWLHSRNLDVMQPEGAFHRTDCVIVRTVVEGDERNLCIMSPAGLNAPRPEAIPLRVMEGLFPEFSQAVDRYVVSSIALKAAVKAVGAEGGDLVLLEPEEGNPVYTDTFPPAKSAVDTTPETGRDTHLFKAMSRSRLPLLVNDTADRGLTLHVPLIAGGRVLGRIGVTTIGKPFDIAAVARVLFVISAQLGLYLGGNAKWVEASSTDDARMRVRTLGAFEITVDGQHLPQSRFRRRKALTLLKLLATYRGRPAPRDALIEALWPQADPKRAGANLRVVLHSLQHTLEPGLPTNGATSFVLTQGDMVYLDCPSSVWLDTVEFERHARQVSALIAKDKCTEALEESQAAASLYGGEYLDEEPYSDWCLFERVRLRETYIDLLKKTAKIMAEADEISDAIETCRAILRVDSGREEVHRDLMRLLWSDGRGDEALRQYEACRDLLVGELGTEPSRETVRTYEAIRSSLSTGS